MDIQKFYSICLQGNVLEAIEYLRLFKDKNEDVLKLEKQFSNRFLSQEESYTINSEDSWKIIEDGCVLSQKMNWILTTIL